MYARIETSKLMTYKAAWLKENKMTYTMESAMCKMLASEAATYVTKEAIANPGRIRIYLRLRGRADVPRRQDHRDLRGHQRGPANRDLKSVTFVR